MNVHKVAVLFSGGVESTTLLYIYLQKGQIVYPVYVKMGESWESLELENAIKLWHYTKDRYASLRPLRILSMQKGKMKDRRPHTVPQLFIPLRNLILITTCAFYAISKDIKRLAIGSLGLYPFPDNDKGYIKQVERLIEVGSNSDFSVELPLFGLEKKDIVKNFYRKVPYHLTLSCAMPRKIAGKIVPCGKCVKCIERKEALMDFL